MSISEAPPKKRKNGRAKGKRGENAVAKMCTAWWAQLEPGVEFRSTPSSGGWATPQLRGHFKVAGDLTTTAKHWPFTVEVKLREAWVIANVYKGKSSPVWGWWAQACKSAAEEGRIPILFFRKNRSEWFVILPNTIRNVDALAFPIRCGMVPMIVTTWEALCSRPPAAIIRACQEPASPPALGASQARPKAKSRKAPPSPSKARQRPAQVGASSRRERLAKADKQTKGYFNLISPSANGSKKQRAAKTKHSPLDSQAEPDPGMMLELALLPKRFLEEEEAMAESLSQH